jgi:hypothetical protein
MDEYVARIPRTFFGGLGFTGYNEVVKLLSENEDIKKVIINIVTPKVTAEVLKDSKKQISGQLQKNNAALEAHLANIGAAADKRIEDIVRQFNTQLVAINNKEQIKPIIVEPYPVDSGYAFYGIRSGSSWESRYFKVLGDAPAEPPKVGDKLQALSNVNIREDYISFGITGWSNALTLGVIVPKDKLEVIEVKQVVLGYYWIRFENRRRENN